MPLMPDGSYQIDSNDQRLQSPLSLPGGQEDPRKKMMLAGLGQGIQRAASAFAPQSGPAPAPGGMPISPQNMGVNPIAQGDQLGKLPTPTNPYQRILGGGQPTPGFLRFGGL